MGVNREVLEWFAEILVLGLFLAGIIFTIYLTCCVNIAFYWTERKKVIISFILTLILMPLLATVVKSCFNVSRVWNEFAITAENMIGSEEEIEITKTIGKILRVAAKIEGIIPELSDYIPIVAEKWYEKVGYWIVRYIISMICIAIYHYSITKITGTYEANEESTYKDIEETQKYNESLEKKYEYTISAEKDEWGDIKINTSKKDITEYRESYNFNKGERHALFWALSISPIVTYFVLIIRYLILIRKTV